MAYTVTFWGTRGSIPTPGAHTARYGGNTPCVAVEGTGGQLVILDAGTGIRALGVQLVERRNGAVKAEILLSHAHWDHIQGLPHFKPFFSPGNVVRIWGSRQGTMSLEAILRQQMDPAVFPVPLDALSAKLDVEQVDGRGGDFTIGAFRVRSMILRHPGTTLAFRLTPVQGGPSMAYATDKELEDHRGWGHSTWAEAVALAAEAKVKRLVLFHHEPEHDDATLDQLLAAARKEAQKRGGPAEVLAAQEGMHLTL